MEKTRYRSTTTEINPYTATQTRALPRKAPSHACDSYQQYFILNSDIKAPPTLL